MPLIGKKSNVTSRFDSKKVVNTDIYDPKTPTAVVPKLNIDHVAQKIDDDSISKMYFNESKAKPIPNIGS
jgi:hypothetical protein